MTIDFYTNTDPKIAVSKHLSSGTTYTGECKENTDISNPTILIRSASVPVGNYIYIADFSRYYYIEKIVNVAKELWEVTAHVDVLMSFSASFMSSPCIVAKTASNDFNLYLPDPNFKCQQNARYGMVNFPNGFDMAGAKFYMTFFG